MTDPSPAGTTPSPLPTPAPAEVVRGRPDRSGAWAGAWLVTYASIAAAWWGTIFLAHAVVAGFAEFGVRWAAVRDLDGGMTEAEGAFAEVLGRVPDAIGAEGAPLFVVGAALAACLGGAGIGVLCRSGFARLAAAGFLVGTTLLVVAHTAFQVFVVHSERVRWVADARQALADLRTAGRDLPPDVTAWLTFDPVSAIVFETALQAFHLAILALLTWGVLRRGTARWCS